MKYDFLEMSQMLAEHPVLEEDAAFRAQYINVLEYFHRQYSASDQWAQAALGLYKKEFFAGPYQYDDAADLKKLIKPVIATKFRQFKFFTYRYCLLFDCIFLNACQDRSRGEAIFQELAQFYSKRKRETLLHVFCCLYDTGLTVSGIDKTQYLWDCWLTNRAFLSALPVRVLVTANMSAGKSTLLNALIGKKINKTQNDACTAKIHYIKSKPYEDGFTYKHDFFLNLNANAKTLMEDSSANSKSKITVSTFFRTVNSPAKRLWLIDTPGVNSSQDENHKKIAENSIFHAGTHLLIYVLNGENIGTDDDRRHLTFIQKNFDGKIIFVINKLDRFRKSEDSVPETIKAVEKDLKNMGFHDPMVVPVSAYAGYLAKMRIFGETLEEDEQDEYDRMARKLRKVEYQFDAYYPWDIQKAVQLRETGEEYQLLLHSGVLHLEKIIYNLRG